MYAYFPTLADQTPEPKDEGVKGLQPIGKRDADLQSLTGDEEQTITVGVGDGELATGHRNRIKRVAPTDGVVFHALLSGKLLNPTPGHIIQFTNVITNVGGNYHSSTGVFTCTWPGVYLFSWSTRVVGGPSQRMDSVLVRNGVALGYNTAGAAANVDPSGHGTATVAVPLVQGDEIWIKVVYVLHGTDLYGSYTMFTGVLVHG